MNDPKFSLSHLPGNTKLSTIQEILANAAGEQNKTPAEAPLTPEQLNQGSPDNNINARNLAASFNLPSGQELATPTQSMQESAVPIELKPIQDPRLNPALSLDVGTPQFQKQMSDFQKQEDNFNTNKKLDSRNFLASLLNGNSNAEHNTQVDSPASEVSKPSEVPVAVQSKAPVSNIKQSFQATQSPEQKAAAQAGADAQDPLVDTEMQQALQASQENRDRNSWKSGLFEMMGGLGSLGGSKVSSESEALKQAIAGENSPMSDINAKRDQYKKFLGNKEEKDKNDPNSAASKTMRDALAGMGVKIPENASYATMEKLAPQLMKNKEFQMKLEEMKLKREELGIVKQAAAGSKADLLASKDAEAFRKAYDPQLASSRSVLGKEASRYVQSQHAMNLIKDVGDLSKITPMQKRELAVALATMLSPGIPHESTIHALDEKTLNGELASMVQKITGAPASTNTAGLTKQLKTSVANQQKVSAANIKKSQEAIKATFGKQIASNPELYNQVMKSIDLTSDDVKPSEHQNKPKTVIQNGHTYTLNEATGEYE